MTMPTDKKVATVRGYFKKTLYDDVNYEFLLTDIEILDDLGETIGRLV